MKRRRVSEEQIIGVLREHEAGAETADLAREQWGLRGDTVHLESQVRRHGWLRCPPAQDSSGQRQAESATFVGAVAAETKTRRQEADCLRPPVTTTGSQAAN